VRVMSEEKITDGIPTEILGEIQLLLDDLKGQKCSLKREDG